MIFKIISEFLENILKQKSKLKGLKGTSARQINLIKIKTKRFDIPESRAAVGMPPSPGTVATSEVATNGGATIRPT
ncbi:hypothetical protein CEXT_225961 [Caerostris extrusa]|uniref:Uncharacterized protein n=1 Tax=Caerostris extrusa TaxID=172846 RepID=A0AAV4XX36_CAEEX|nr:hypothetical protein CEXT_225961 [Caerostris extrusa]